MLELFFSLYLQAAVLLSGGTTTQTQTTQPSITQPTAPVNSATNPNTTTTIGGGGWDDKN